MSEDKLPSKKHVQVPNNMTKNSKIEPRDLLVYSVIKKYSNWETNETFVGLETITVNSLIHHNSTYKHYSTCFLLNFISP